MKRIAPALIILSLSLALAAQTTPPPSAASSKPAEKKEPTAGEKFKNVQVLKDVPASEWFPTMQFISGALGVGCDHCHVNPFPKDDKPAKARAREMMKMVQAINAQNFSDQQNRVTCMTCHNGSTKPARTPVTTENGWYRNFLAASAEQPPASTAAAPDAQQLIAKYRSAIGAANAASVRSRYYKGTATLYNGTQAPRSVEQVVYIAGDQVHADFTNAEGTQSSIYNGHQGWVVTPKETHAMSDDELSTLKTRLLGSLKIDYLPQFTAAANKGAEEIRGHHAWAVDLTTADNKTVTAFFNQQTGLLVALRSTVTSAFGKVPEETWYDDYRDFGGVKLPMTVISAAVNNGTIRRYDEIQLNLPVDQKRFAPPAAATGTGN
jgi:photosynthetic reaction center cytochrome c subunit